MATFLKITNTRENPEMLSYTRIRRAIGVLGMALPVVLLIAGALFHNLLGGKGIMMPSISHYYYTYLVTVFTGTLCAVGLFLITYKGYGPADDAATNMAGFCAFCVALFPTTHDSLQFSIYYMDFVTPPGWIHFTFAASLFLILAFISIFIFTKTNPQKQMTDEKRNRNKIYKWCGYLMVLFVALIAVCIKLGLEKYNTTFWLEMASLWAFGISWLTKGELISGDKAA